MKESESLTQTAGLERAILGAVPTYTAADVAAESGITVDLIGVYANNTLIAEAGLTVT